MKTAFVGLALLSAVFGASARADDLVPCSHWPETMAAVMLKNAGKITPDELGHPNVTHELLAFQKVNKDTAREVYLLTFKRPSGETIRVITQNDVTPEECSGSGVKAFLADPLGPAQESESKP
ncbi:hypothetical protein AA23498_2161 [Acetobacter nitrogenifigens DSM 23921 = NBRC 105050]|uniref:Lipoprotein n=1 Tax=Acetobacter nitrogenifigens DSM 23921 = NBRC 105050 TaxID=1120919 RepID=A0A511X6W6_9PROT|nr:hypothetical protein [Acetobacter nitrogenifigens]GBQ94967.1 hypothetical protein AA23498_2161 [Acetobacter nitrogenifigens DSM 23921 = NBRC 105050]GEN58665.1 hypothetical protein ANI02nite_05490 [Acetobacter nitrogenifigens DSM 23921 = NBRC 105050]